ncbi:MAG: DUF4403 family protein [Bacteroidota bacterium]
MKNNRISRVSIPISVNINDVEKIINKQMQGMLYEDNDMSDNNDDGLMLKVEKNGAIRLQLDGQHLNYQVPLSIWVKKRLALADVEAEGALTLDIRTHYEIKPDWTLVTQTRILKHEWQQKPALRLGFLDLPGTFVADRILDRSQHHITRAIDKQMKDKLDLKKYVGEAWLKLQDAILLSEEYRLWLILNLRSMSMTPIKTVDNFIKSTVSAEASAEAVMGQRPPTEIDAILPGFRMVEEAGRDFVVHLVAAIPFAEAEKVARQFVIGETFSSGNQKVTIEDIQLSGRDEQLLINTTVSGSYDGSIFLKGKPVYNPTLNAIEMEGLDFELNTRNIIFKSIGWLFKKGLIKKMQKSLRFPLDENINEVKGMVKEKLADFEVAPNIRIKGQLDDLTIEETSLSNTAIHVRIASEGALDVLVDGLEM